MSVSDESVCKKTTIMKEIVMRRVLLIAVSLLAVLLSGCGGCYLKTIEAGQVKCTEVPKNWDGSCPDGCVTKCP